MRMVDGEPDGYVHEGADGLLRVVAASPWRPIETAPRDGTPILLCGQTGDRIVGRWSTAFSGSWVLEAYDAIGIEPTHWMPLPSPPPKG